MGPGQPVQLVGVVGEGHPQPVGEEMPDVGGRPVDGRGDDVRRAVLGDLDDELAQVRLDHPASVGFEGVVESDLLGDHGLRLDHPLDPVGAGDLAHVVHRLGGVCGEEHGAAEPLDSVRELLEVPIEVGEGVKADPPCPVAHRLERSVVGHRSVAHLGEAAGAGQVGPGAVASEGAGGALHEGDGLAHDGTEPPRISAM